MRKPYLLIIVLAIAAWSCKKEKAIVVPPKPPKDTVAIKQDTADFNSVKLEVKNNAGIITSDLNLTIAGDSITGVIPAMKSSKKLVITFAAKTTGTTVKVGDTILISGTTAIDYSKPVTLNIATPKGLSKSYRVKVKNFTGLPILYLTTNGPVVSKDDYVTGSLTVDPNVDFQQDQLTIPLQIKGRGNSTWGFPKKPYRMKFSSKAAMLGMPAAKNWVLLANYDDKTLIRNWVAFDLARRLGADFTPPARFVEVVMNGEFIGNYMLTTQVEVNENRVNITELKSSDNSADKITGGYLLELDERRDADFWFETTKGLPITIKSPDAITTAQLDYIKTYIQDTENAIFSTDFDDPAKGYAKYINTDSFINWYFTAEIMKNQDSWDFSSIYYYKDRGGKLGMGPAWDFDLSLGNVDYSVASQPLEWYTRNAKWMIRLHQDYNFREKVKKRWNEDIKGKIIKQILADIDSQAAYLELSQRQNFQKWDILNTYVWPNNVVLGSYSAEVAYIKDFLNKRVAWIDAAINDPANGY
ncbi:CotH kinase family protein [Mucilaginibacter sp. CAU 1740]|uniref:CotH kinase family protein n=1 Tax=Mucilaginibacter sp. CAU 1740 TaxID=3140365 RepID=UPI00325C0DBE